MKEKALEMVATIKKYQHLLIYLKGSPDPDSVAAAFGFKLICESLGVKATIDSPVYPSLPQNVKIIKDLHLPIEFKSLKNSVKDCDAYVVLDHQSVFVEGVTGVIPCGVHIDHHKIIDEEISVDFKLIKENVGSTSTIIIFLVKELGLQFKEPDWARAATALYYGIQTDTDSFRNAAQVDMEALDMVTPHADKVLLNKIFELPFPKEAMAFLNLALQNQIIYQDWLISGIGFIESKFRDNIAIISDFLLKHEGISTVVVFTIVEKEKGLTLDASFRSKDESLNLNRLIKGLSREGGARSFKGAYQVNLDYFIHCPDRYLLWKVVYDTTIEALKKKIDEATLSSIRQIFNRLKRSITNLFK